MNNLIYFIHFFRIVNALFELFLELLIFLKKIRLNFEKIKPYFNRPLAKVVVAESEKPILNHGDTEARSFFISESLRLCGKKVFDD